MVQNTENKTLVYIQYVLNFVFKFNFYVNL